MKSMFQSMKFWEIVFLALAIILVSPLFIEFLLVAIIPLAVVGLIPSIMAFKERKFYIILVNVLVIIGSFAFYLYLW